MSEADEKGWALTPTPGADLAFPATAEEGSGLVPTPGGDQQDGTPRCVGADVIVPVPWCSCGGALGIAPGRVIGFERGAVVVDIDLSSCSTRPTPPHCTLPPLVYTRQEIEELRWVL